MVLSSLTRRRMTHLRAMANRKLAKIFKERISLLQEDKRVPLKEVGGRLGEKPFRVIMSGHANTLGKGLVRKAVDALGLPIPELNEALVLIPIALQGRGGISFSRRRNLPFRSRHSFRR